MNFPAFVNVEGGFLSRLLAAAGRSPSSAAILHTHRGRQIVYTWKDVVSEVDRFAAGLSFMGLCSDNVLVVQGEISPRLLIAAAAARAVGARVISAPPQANAVECVRVFKDASVAVVLVQSREVAETWSDAGQGVGIVLDQATAGGNGTAIFGVQTVDALRNVARPRGWATDLPEGVRIVRTSPVVWVEETTAWRNGVEVILDRWIGEAATLAMPELLTAADRDRRQVMPDAWIVSACRLDSVIDCFRLRLPEPSTPTGKLVAWALEMPSTIWSRPLVALIRRRLGLDAVTCVDLYESPNVPSMADSRQWLAILGIDAADRREVLRVFEQQAVNGGAS